ncbi:MAG: DUF4268 domain-containing protein [Candidatus Omnitrophica bacterium]|nr:DUF4268 domain-containing protein [Candidatus Omnitrophota bacterium]
MPLGRIKTVDLRNVWKNEAHDFTTWLAQKENLDLLSEKVGIDMKVIGTEANVGTFTVDILAEEENTGRKIIIENQLETTDHDHLGKLITYASGYEAEIVIWLVKDVREEHRQAIDWLNEHTDENLSFFIIKMELKQIDDSPYAPDFRIISNPNDWAKTIKKSTLDSTLSDTKSTQLEFWTKFKEYALKNRTALRLRKTYPQHWYDISFGSSEAHVCLTINTQNNQIGCEIYINDSKETFSKLHQNKDKIEHELGEKLKWLELPERKASRIRLFKEADINKVDRWEESFKWLQEEAEKFQRVFRKYL